MSNWLGFDYLPTDADAFLVQARKNSIGQTLKSVCDSLGATAPQGNDVDVATRLARLERLIGQGPYRNVRAMNNATTPASKIDVSWEMLAISGYQADSYAQTLDFATTGARGRETAWSYAAEALFLYAIYNPTTNTADTLMSKSPPSVGPTSMPSGFTAWRYLSSWYNTTTAAALRRQGQQDQIVTTTVSDASAFRAVSAVTTTTTWTTPTLTAANRPTGVRMLLLQGRMASGSGSGAITLRARTKTVGTSNGVDLCVQDSGVGKQITIGGAIWVMTNSAGDFEWSVDSAQTGMTATIDVLGWMEPL